MTAFDNVLVILICSPLQYNSNITFYGIFMTSSMINLNNMGYIVPFLTISSILIDICFTNVIIR